MLIELGIINLFFVKFPSSNNPFLKLFLLHILSIIAIDVSISNYYYVLMQVVVAQ